MMFTRHPAPKVLVTGATGFVGHACVTALLAQGCTVIGTCRGAPPPARAGVTWAPADLFDAEAVRQVLDTHRPTHLLALGWYMGPGNLGSSDNYRWTQHSINLIYAFAAAGGQRVTFCGSCTEYDWSTPVPLREDRTPLRPNTDYGWAKAALYTAFGPLCAALGLSGSWGRPFFMYGPHESRRRLAADVITSLLTGREALCSHGMQMRDFLHVTDVGEALTRLLLSDLTGAVNIGSGQAIPLATLVNEVGRQTGRADLIRLGARNAPPDDPPLVVADMTRLRQDLHWSPRIGLEDGIAQTIDWWREHIEERV